MPRVIHHQRLPYKGQVSIERLFEDIRAHLPERWQACSQISPLPSKGMFPRIKNLRHAGRQVGNLHHIVGDVHYLAFGLPREKIVLTIHDCAALYRLNCVKREILRYFWFTGPMKRAAMVTTISETTKQELRQWVGDLADKVVVIPNCVCAEFTPDAKPFNDQAPICLQVGTSWNKNVQRVAQALVGTPCRLEIVGEISEMQRVALEVTRVPFRELGRISDQDLLRAYRRCDFLIFASLYEGFGLPILEAQATGRPVITSCRSAMPEAAGDGALFVNPESIESIHAAVLQLLADSDGREQLIARGYENVSNYRPEVIAAKYAEVYEKVMRPSHT